MSTWSLRNVLEGLHDDIEHRLKTIRRTMHHSVSMGDASEAVWSDLFNTYLPARYKAARAHVVDSSGGISECIDVVIFDRQYSPFIFSYGGEVFVPAESVYAVFEAKQEANRKHIKYAQKKVRSVRDLHRTSLPYRNGDKLCPAKVPCHIYGGLLTVDSCWKGGFGESLSGALALDDDQGKLDCGCVAAHGYFCVDDAGQYEFHSGGKPATAFLFRLISQLQGSGTVPMIDVQAYGRWLEQS